MHSSSQPRPAAGWAFALGLALSIALVLALPLFPTGDGPVHLYYARVLGSLLRHQPAYAGDYAIRHLLAPYLIHYLFLIALPQTWPLALGEKLLVALIFLVTGLGFRSLARSLGPHASLACVWMLPLLWSWALGGGFLNFCFATGISLWSFSLWVGLGAEPSPGLRHTLRLFALFAVSLLLLLLSHPIPLLVLLALFPLDLLLRAAYAFHASEQVPWAPMRRQAVALVLTGVASVTPVLLAEKGQAAAVLPGLGFHRDIAFELLTGMRLGLFGVDRHSALRLLALAAWVATLLVPAAVAVLLAVRRAGTARRWLPGSAATRLFVAAGLFTAATVFFPHSLNHSYFFPERLWYVMWLLLLAPAAAARLTSNAQRVALTGGLVVLLLTLTTGYPVLLRAAREQARLAALPLPARSRVLLLQADTPNRVPLRYPVFFWAPVRAVAQSGAVLLDSPWLELTILPLRQHCTPATPRPLLDCGVAPIYSENPTLLSHALLGDLPAEDADKQLTAEQKRNILGRADSVLYQDPSLAGDGGNNLNDDARVLAEAEGVLRTDAAHWSCRAHDGFYALCERVP